MIFADPMVIRINTGLARTAFDYDDADFAFALAHETVHLSQAGAGNYQATRANRRFLQQHVASAAFRAGLEPPAYQYACANTTGIVGYAPKCTP
jgi:hypothetical protein